MRTMQGGRVKRAEVPRGLNGRGLCRWCSLEVPPRRFTFCSPYCVHEWRLRSQPAYLREQVLLRDKGMCGSCGVDTLFQAPVVEGGGECDLANIRTLCLRCHRAATAALRERIRRAKVAAMLEAERAA